MRLLAPISALLLLAGVSTGLLAFQRGGYGGRRVWRRSRSVLVLRRISIPGKMNIRGRGFAIRWREPAVAGTDTGAGPAGRATIPRPTGNS